MVGRTTAVEITFPWILSAEKDYAGLSLVP